MSLVVIGFLTFMIVDLAHVWRCAIGHGTVLIIILSVGFSLPEALTSAKAASQSKQAEPAMAHVFGTSAINFCLGIGLPWVYGAFWMHKQEEG